MAEARSLGGDPATPSPTEVGRIASEVAAPIPAAFASALSHRIRTPLDSITGYAEMLADATVEPRSPQWDDVIDRIRHGVRELLDGISLTLRFAGIDARNLASVSDPKAQFPAMDLGVHDRPGPPLATERRIGHAPGHTLPRGTKENPA